MINEYDVKEQLFNRVNKFMEDNRISCEDAIYQCDWVIENAYEFIADLYNIVDQLKSDEI